MGKKSFVQVKISLKCSARCSFSAYIFCSLLILQKTKLFFFSFQFPCLASDADATSAALNSTAINFTWWKWLFVSFRLYYFSHSLFYTSQIHRCRMLYCRIKQNKTNSLDMERFTHGWNGRLSTFFFLHLFTFVIHFILLIIVIQQSICCTHM